MVCLQSLYLGADDDFQSKIFIQFDCLYHNIHWPLPLQFVNFLNSIEEHCYKCRSNMMDVAENLSTAKKNEIQHLMHMVQLVSILPECTLIKLF